MTASLLPINGGRRPPMMADVQADCAECKTSTTISAVSLSGMTPGEQIDACQPRLERLGWAARRDTRGGREFICPKCVVAIADKTVGALPAFDAKAKCPKCQHNKVATRYWTGRELEAPLGVPREHIGRTCERCGFVFVQACADQKKQ